MQFLLFRNLSLCQKSKNKIAQLIAQGVPAGEIVVLSPFLHDSLRFLLSASLEARGGPFWSYRSSRSLMDEPSAACLVMFAELAYREWALRPPLKVDVAYALARSIEGLDLIRAGLLVEALYRPGQDGFALSSFQHLVPEMQERITYHVGMRYEALRSWLATYSQLPEKHNLDVFFGELFGGYCPARAFSSEPIWMPAAWFHTCGSRRENFGGRPNKNSMIPRSLGANSWRCCARV